MVNLTKSSLSTRVKQTKRRIGNRYVLALVMKGMAPWSLRNEEMIAKYPSKKKTNNPTLAAYLYSLINSVGKEYILHVPSFSTWAESKH